MSALFLEVLNASIAAGWVALAVIAARLALKRAPRWMVCGLWSLVGLRLVVSGSIEAPFSLIPSTRTIPPESLYDPAPVINSGVAVIDRVVNPVYTESFRAQEVASVNPLQVWTAVAANLWVLGMIVMGLWAVISWLRIRRQVRESIPVGDGSFLCDRIDSPFIFGLFKPKIYLPSELDDGARAHVVAHERAHIARLDHWWKPLGFGLLAVNWFNPVLWVAYVLLCRDIEMACDERVVREMDVGEKKAYSSALLACSLPRRAIAACPLAFGEVGVKARVKSVLNYKKPAFWVILVAAVVSVVLTACLLTSPESEAAAEEPWYLLTLKQGALSGSEELTGAAAEELHQLLRELPKQDLSPAPALDWNEYAADSDAFFTIIPEEQTGNSYGLFRTSEHGWVGFSREPESGDSVWYIDGSSLEQFLQSYEAELQWAGSCFPRPEDAALTLEFQTIRKDGVQLRAAIPCLEQGDSHIHFEWEQLENSIGFRFRPIGGTGWITVSYDPDAAPFVIDPGTPVPGDLPNDTAQTSGSLWNDRWEYRQLETERGQLVARMDPEVDWWADHGSMAEAILSTVSASVGGESVMAEPNLLGIQLSTEDVSPSGLTLVYHQDGTPWNAIYTGSSYNIARWYEEEGTWGLLPARDGTAWTMEARTVPQGESVRWKLDWSWIHGELEPGRYRIYKDFSGERGMLAHREEVSQTYYADFTIDTMNITLRAEDVTTQGLRLIYSHQGSTEEWNEIVTGSAWTLERLENGSWVNVLPEDITWSAIRQQLPIHGTTAWNISFQNIYENLGEGQYRIGKTFYGYPNPIVSDNIKSTTQVIEQTCYAQFTLNPLGISVSVKDVTSKGATLVCSQDGTFWHEIITGTDWMLERYENGQWVSVMPESTVWTTMAYLMDPGTTRSYHLNWSLITGELVPGQYRAGKTFTGERRLMSPPALGEESVTQTYWAEFTIDPAEPTLPVETGFSAELVQAVLDDWLAYEAMSPFDRMASSKTPGSCAREFDDWAEVQRFVGMELANPLEGLDDLEKGCWAATPVGYNGALRFRVTWSGTREGQVQRVQIESGYRRDGMRVSLNMTIPADPSSDAQNQKEITADSGELYEARTKYLDRGSVRYSIRVIGEPGTGEVLMTLLQELLPHFEEIPSI